MCVRVRACVIWLWSNTSLLLNVPVSGSLNVNYASYNFSSVAVVSTVYTGTLFLIATTASVFSYVPIYIAVGFCILFRLFPELLDPLLSTRGNKVASIFLKVWLVCVWSVHCTTTVNNGRAEKKEKPTRATMDVCTFKTLFMGLWEYKAILTKQMVDLAKQELYPRWWMNEWRSVGGEGDMVITTRIPYWRIHLNYKKKSLE